MEIGFNIRVGEVCMYVYDTYYGSSGSSTSGGGGMKICYFLF